MDAAERGRNNDNNSNSSSNDATVEEYVAAMRQKDACQDHGDVIEKGVDAPSLSPLTLPSTRKEAHDQQAESEP